MTPTDALIEKMARAILAKVPFGYGMTEAEALVYARAAYSAEHEEDGK